jgi:hypothetical protein
MKGDLRHASFEGSLHLGSHIIAFDLQGKPTIINFETVKRHPVPHSEMLSYADPRWPDDRFDIERICNTPTGRWFLGGDFHAGRWADEDDWQEDQQWSVLHDCAVGPRLARETNADHQNYLEVSAQEAAAWFIRAETELPELLARLVGDADTNVEAERDRYRPIPVNRVPGEAKALPPRTKAARGTLDERAVIALKKNPSLTNEQLASILECNANTLRNRHKCPLLASARAMIKAQRDEYRDGSSWRDRRADEDAA